LFVVGIGVLLAGLVTTAESAPVGVLISVAGLLIMIAAAVAVLSGAAGATDLSRGVRPRADGDARFGGCGDTDRSWCSLVPSAPIDGRRAPRAFRGQPCSNPRECLIVFDPKDDPPSGVGWGRFVLARLNQ
jgi:hypothetical protein